jgi:hypothetical protein
MTFVLNDKKALTYVENRLSGKNANIHDVQKIDLYRGFLHPDVEQQLSNKGSFERVIQKSPREFIYIGEDGTLSICESSGMARGRRYETNIDRFLDITGHDIEFNRNLFPENDKTLLKHYYSNLAYDFVRRLYVPKKKYQATRIFEDVDISSIDDFVVGPLDVVAKEAEVVEIGNSNYLDCQVVRIKGKNILNLGYIYGDQAHFIFDKIFNQLSASNTARAVNVYVFGRVGALYDEARINDLITPTGVINEEDINSGKTLIYPVDNILAGKGKNGINLNVQSVINETVEMCETAKQMGGVSIDLELLWFLLAQLNAKGSYQSKANGNNLEINLGYIGHVSDMPLQGITIEQELKDDKGAKKAFNVIAEHIKNK